MDISRKSLGYAICPLCNQKVNILFSGKAKMHHGPFNGKYYPVCNGSGLKLEAAYPREKKPWDKYKLPEDYNYEPEW